MEHSRSSRPFALRSELHLVRKLWHMGAGFFLTFPAFLGVSRTTLLKMYLMVLVLALSVEGARFFVSRFNTFLLHWVGFLFRKEETSRLSGVPAYVSAAFLVTLVFPYSIAILSLLLLAFCDPMASLGGVLLGKEKGRFRNGKTWAGFFAGAGSGFLVSGVFLMSYPLSFSQWMWVVLVGGCAAAASETFFFFFNDNFSIPVFSSFCLWFFCFLSGIPLV